MEPFQNLCSITINAGWYFSYRLRGQYRYDFYLNEKIGVVCSSPLTRLVRADLYHPTSFRVNNSSRFGYKNVGSPIQHVE